MEPLTSPLLFFSVLSSSPPFIFSRVLRTLVFFALDVTFAVPDCVAFSLSVVGAAVRGRRTTPPPSSVRWPGLASPPPLTGFLPASCARKGPPLLYPTPEAPPLCFHVHFTRVSLVALLVFYTPCVSPFFLVSVLPSSRSPELRGCALLCWSARTSVYACTRHTKVVLRLFSPFRSCACVCAFVFSAHPLPFFPFLRTQLLPFTPRVKVRL